MRKESYTLTQILNSIWRRGDQDEMSIKHIGHALAALIAHNDWRKGDDYTRPDYCDFENPISVDYWTKSMDKFLELKWGKVVALRDRVGDLEFIDVLAETQFSFYAFSYLTEDWLSYHNALSADTKAKLNSVANEIMA